MRKKEPRVSGRVDHSFFVFEASVFAGAATDTDVVSSSSTLSQRDHYEGGPQTGAQVHWSTTSGPGTYCQTSLPETGPRVRVESKTLN